MSKTGKGLSGSNLFSQLKGNPGFLDEDVKETKEDVKENKKEEETGRPAAKKAPAAAGNEKKEAQKKKPSASRPAPAAPVVPFREEESPRGSKKTGRKAERKLPVIPFKINGHDPVPVAYDDPDVPKKSIITIYTDQDMKERFKDACYHNRLTMSEAVCFLVEQFIRETELQSGKK